MRSDAVFYHLAGFVTLAVVLPSVIFYAQNFLLWGSFPTPLAFAASVLIVVWHVLAYLALALMLGTMFRGRGVLIIRATSAAPSRR